ncbi:MAG: helix-turn-helix transcriptional regulator [Erysipelotrichaceae bacterium]|nr:helix-turn-helix transcriptional regulator [Erysipelotrichaceae bacterium]
MSEGFNKKRMFDNILFMLAESGMKIGELEASVGVSPGYISRTNKEEYGKPGIDFIVNVSNVLGISIDNLLNTNMTDLNPTERFLIPFLEKLKKDTIADIRIWNIESADSLNRQEPAKNGSVEHPLFSYETLFEKSEIEGSEQVSKVVMMSKSFGCNTYISGDCFNLNVANDAVIYFMNISKSGHNINESAKEIWMYQPEIGEEFICSNKDSSPLALMVEDLYRIIVEQSKYPKIDDDFVSIINMFMNDD